MDRGIMTLGCLRGNKKRTNYGQMEEGKGGEGEINVDTSKTNYLVLS